MKGRVWGQGGKVGVRREDGGGVRETAAAEKPKQIFTWLTN